jgi:hypothetical protein
MRIRTYHFLCCACLESILKRVVDLVSKVIYDADQRLLNPSTNDKNPPI